MEERFIVQTSMPERLFVKVYRDFLNSKLLNGKEQIIFIHLKQYINFANDNGTVQGEVYPTLNTLAENVKMSEKTIRTVLQSLQKKGILEIKQQGLNKPNIYKINDSAAMWKAENMEELKTAVDKIEEERMIKVLTAKGYYVNKEKALVSDSTPTAETSTHLNNNNILKDTTNDTKSQAKTERYSLENIKKLFDYDVLMADYPNQKEDWDITISILHDTMNSQKETIRISGEDKPREVVVSKLSKLTYYDIQYAVAKFHEQTGEIKNAKAYLLTILYNAREQSYLELMNMGHRNKDF